MKRFIAVALCAIPLASALAQTPTAIYSEIGTSSTSMVPGVDGALFQAFDRPYASPDGSWWIISADTDLATTEDEVIIVGSGVTGSVTVREGTQAPWSAAGDLVGLIDRNLSINNSGHYAFATNLGGAAATSADEQIVGFTGAFAAVATEGGAVPGFPRDAYGATLDSASITNAGQFGFRAPSTVGTLTTNDDDFLIFDGAVLAQELVTIPGGAVEAWDNFGAQDFYVAGDGTSWLAQGDLTGNTASDAVVVVNGNVMIQEDGTIPGIKGPVETIVESFMLSNGAWFARGDVDSQEDWVVHNGDLIARRGDEVPGGEPGELYDDGIFSATFFSMTGDGEGNHVVGAVTNNPDEEANAVLVYNGESLLAREGDPVDLDGDGEVDPDVFISVFNNDDSFLTADGWYYFTADLRDGLGESLGQAFLRVNIPEPSTLMLTAWAAFALRRRRR